MNFLLNCERKNMDGIGYKLKKIRKTLELSQENMAKALGTTGRTLRDYEKENFGVSYDFLNKLIETYKVNPNWIFRNEFPIFLDEETEGLVKNISPEEKADLIYIPKYDPTADAGAGKYTVSECMEYFIAIQSTVIRRIVGFVPTLLSAIEAEGDSMSPLINNGDLIIIDLTRNIPNDGVYVLNINDGLVVKRIQSLPNYKLKVTSENKAYDPYEVDLKTDNVRIAGKVIWQGREIG